MERQDEIDLWIETQDEMLKRLNEEIYQLITDGFNDDKKEE